MKKMLLILCSAMLCTALIAQAQDDPTHVSSLPPKGTFGPNKVVTDRPLPSDTPTGAPLPTRQGGDTCANAVFVASLPYQDTGTTLGFANNYDSACPYTGSTSPDVVYRLNFTTARIVNVTLCTARTNYDSKVYIYQASCPGTVVACNDDSCQSPAYPGGPYNSQVLSVSLNANTNYYVVVDGYGGAGGLYQINITQGEAPPPPPTCPTTNLVWDSPGAGPADAWTFATSDSYYPYAVYDNFGGPMVVQDIHWWGVDLTQSGGQWVECTNANPTPFIIKFYNDNGSGQPDRTNPVATYTQTVSKTYYGLYNAFQVWYWSIPTLTPNANLAAGQKWISIQGNAVNACVFLWLNSLSSVHDHASWQEYTDGSMHALAYDLGFCLTGTTPPTTGACCNQDTGGCQDGVPQSQCIGGNVHWYANQTCAQISCVAPQGACCVNGGCAFDGSQIDCNAAGGEWYAGQTCGTFSCPPPPPIDCTFTPTAPDQQLFGQGTQGSGTGYPADDIYGWIVYDKFTNVSGTIHTVHFWNLDEQWVGSWVECDDPTPLPQYNLTFYPDLAGQPDIANPTASFAALAATEVRRAAVPEWSPNIVKYVVLTLSTPLTMVDGWISIQGHTNGDCGKLWIDSGAGAGLALYDTGTGQLQAAGASMAYCLVGPGLNYIGACCNDLTGVCTNNVNLNDCIGPYLRFGGNQSTCAALTPACGQGTGACCFYADDTCTEGRTATQCQTAGGNWLGNGTTCVQCPCSLPPRTGMTLEGEPVCANDYVDTYNGGCNSTPPVFQDIAGSCTQVIAGQNGNFLAGTTPSRDTDWYRVTFTAPTNVTWYAVGEYQILIFIVQPGPPGLECDSASYQILGNAVSPPCTLASVNATVNAGTYWFLVMTSGFSGVNCGARYYAWLDSICPAGACCIDNVCFTNMTTQLCLANNGAYQGDSSTCTPDPCANSAACCLGHFCSQVDPSGEQACINQGGYFVPGVTCTPSPCPCTNQPRADANCSGGVNPFDIDPFILALTNKPLWMATYTCNYYCANDVNCDGNVNPFDIDPFIYCLTHGGTCLPCP